MTPYHIAEPYPDGSTDADILREPERNTWALPRRESVSTPAGMRDLTHEDYPAFQSASIKHIANVEVDFSNNLHWQDLDIDIEFDALENPEKYPLVYI